MSIELVFDTPTINKAFANISPSAPTPEASNQTRVTLRNRISVNISLNKSTLYAFILSSLGRTEVAE